MEVFIIAAVTIDGKIARDVGQVSTAWTSDADKKKFVHLTKEAGTLVMGSTTYETIGRPLPGRRTIVLTRSKRYDGVEVTSESPKELVARLEAEGVEALAICGGSSIYTQFLKAGVVKKIYLTVEPVAFGSGISLFSETAEVKLELAGAPEIIDNTIFLTYNILH